MLCEQRVTTVAERAQKHGGNFATRRARTYRRQPCGLPAVAFTCTVTSALLTWTFEPP